MPELTRSLYSVPLIIFIAINKGSASFWSVEITENSRFEIYNTFELFVMVLFKTLENFLPNVTLPRFNKSERKNFVQFDLLTFYKISTEHHCLFARNIYFTHSCLS